MKVDPAATAETNLLDRLSRQDNLSKLHATAVSPTVSRRSRRWSANTPRLVLIEDPVGWNAHYTEFPCEDGHQDAGRASNQQAG